MYDIMDIKILKSYIHLCYYNCIYIFIGFRVTMAVVQLMGVSALPLPLVAVLVTLTPPPHDPAKQNTPDEQNPGAVGQLLTRLAALRTVAPLTLPLDSEGAQEPTTKIGGAQEPDTAKACACRVSAIGR